MQTSHKYGCRVAINIDSTKSLKDGIEGLPDTVLNIADNIDREGATSPLLSNHIQVPYKFECTFVVLLAHEDFVGRVFEVADETSLLNVGLEDIEYRDKRSSGLLVPGAIPRGFMLIARWIFLEQ